MFWKIILSIGALQTTRGACSWRSGISRSLLGVHLWPRQPALDEVQRRQHHRVFVGGAWKGLVWGDDQRQCVLPDVHWWQATPADYRYAKSQQHSYIFTRCVTVRQKSRFDTHYGFNFTFSSFWIQSGNKVSFFLLNIFYTCHQLLEVRSLRKENLSKMCVVSLIPPCQPPPLAEATLGAICYG